LYEQKKKMSLRGAVHESKGHRLRAHRSLTKKVARACSSAFVDGGLRHMSIIITTKKKALPQTVVVAIKKLLKSEKKLLHYIFVVR
jgi:hypothetical protein